MSVTVPMARPSGPTRWAVAVGVRAGVGLVGVALL